MLHSNTKTKRGVKWGLSVWREPPPVPDHARPVPFPTPCLRAARDAAGAALLARCVARHGFSRLRAASTGTSCPLPLGMTALRRRVAPALRARALLWRGVRGLRGAALPIRRCAVRSRQSSWCSQGHFFCARFTTRACARGALRDRHGSAALSIRRRRAAGRRRGVATCPVVQCGQHPCRTHARASTLFGSPPTRETCAQVRGEAARAARRGRSAGERTVPERTLSCRFSARLGSRSDPAAADGCAEWRCGQASRAWWVPALPRAVCGDALGRVGTKSVHQQAPFSTVHHGSSGWTRCVAAAPRAPRLGQPTEKGWSRHADTPRRCTCCALSGSVCARSHQTRKCCVRAPPASWTSAPFLRCPTRRDSGHARLAAPRLQRASGSAARVVHFKVS